MGEGTDVSPLSRAQKHVLRFCELNRLIGKKQHKLKKS